MIDLAPNSKTGLPLRSPFILGSGAIGWGEAWPPGIAPEWFGAFVTPPLTLQARRGHTGPRLAEVPGGFILQTGDHNPGLRRVFRDDVERWDALDLPVIVALSGAAPEDWLRLGERLEEIYVAGLEAQLPAGVTPHEAGGWIANLKRGCQLPVLVKLHATLAAPLARACADSGADALVVATPPRGAAPPAWPEATWAGDSGERPLLVEGSVGGPAAFPFTLARARSRGRPRSGAAVDCVRRYHHARRCSLVPAARRRCNTVAKPAVDIAGRGRPSRCRVSMPRAFR